MLARHYGHERLVALREAMCGDHFKFFSIKLVQGILSLCEYFCVDHFPFKIHYIVLKGSTHNRSVGGHIQVKKSRVTTAIERNRAVERIVSMYVDLEGAVREVRQKLGESMWLHRVKVYTNLDPAAQTAAQKIMNSGISSASKGVDQGALVCMSIRDGALLAMVGGVCEYRDNQRNRALFPHTAGSAFKPFVYLTGLTKGILQPDTLIDDAPLAVADDNGGDKYEPKNFDGTFKGWITVRDALAQSRNVCAVRVAMQTGIEPIVETARAAGITSRLGSVSVSRARRLRGVASGYGHGLCYAGAGRLLYAPTSNSSDRYRRRDRPAAISICAQRQLTSRAGRSASRSDAGRRQSRDRLPSPVEPMPFGLIKAFSMVG